MHTPSYRPQGWQLFGLIAVLVLAMSVAAVAAQPELVEGLRSAIRATDRKSVV